jgi:RNase P subunit RPR2
MKYYETPDVDRERMPSVQGVCKDCGNGTLNNELNYQFEVSELEDGSVIVSCRQCGSAHLDIVTF